MTPITTADYHTGGEPFRIVTGGVPELAATTVAEKRLWAADNVDHIRQLLINEPRGHADMYGCFVTPPDDEDAAMGVVFFHNDGYSTACGHGTIALATWAVETGMVATPPQAESVAFNIDAPSGRLPVTVTLDWPSPSTDQLDASVAPLRPVVRDVAFRNVPAFVASEIRAPLPDGGEATGTVAFGGAFYAVFRAGDFGLSVTPPDLPVIIELCRGIKDEVNAAGGPVHPHDGRLDDIYGVILVEEVPVGDIDPSQLPADLSPDAIIQRNVTVFADGEVDRSPTGSGTSARLAILHAADEIAEGQQLVNLSIVDSVMTGVVTGTTTVGNHSAVHTTVSGRAFATGTHTFTVDPRDPIGTGFQLR